MEPYIIPVKREMWEHNGAFVKVPAVIFVVLCISILAAIALGRAADFGQSYHYQVQMETEHEGDTREFEYSDIVLGETDSVTSNHHSTGALPFPEKEINEGAGIINSISYIAFSGILFLISISYLLGALSADRRDGSILFWKSMPVSETQNVLTKVVVASCVLSAIAWVCALAFSLVLLIVATVLALMSGYDGALSIVWQEQALIGTAWQHIGSFLAAALWRLPLVAWLLLASAYAKKTPFLLAVAPLLGLIVVEKIILGSTGMFSLFLDYIAFNVFLSAHATSGWGSLWVVLTSMQFWLGTLLACGMFYGVVWLRENRYES